MPAVYECRRCRYHYEPEKLDEIDSGEFRYFICADRARCDANIAKRKRGQEALKR